MARLVSFDFGFLGGLGPDFQSTPDCVEPEVHSMPTSDPLGDFRMYPDSPMNDTPDLVDSREFRITEGTVTGQRPRVRRGNSTE